jgi:hypothetical protein
MKTKTLFLSVVRQQHIMGQVRRGDFQIHRADAHALSS